MIKYAESFAHLAYVCVQELRSKTSSPIGSTGSESSKSETPSSNSGEERKASDSDSGISHLSECPTPLLVRLSATIRRPGRPASLAVQRSTLPPVRQTQSTQPANCSSFWTLADNDGYNTVTCYCGKPFAGRPMIECSHCLTWIHLSCARIRRTNIPDEFICAKCREKGVTQISNQS